VGPQHDFAVSRLPGEALALGDQPRTDAKSARPRLDQQQPQLRHPLRLLHQEDTANVLALAFRDPATRALRIMVCNEGGDDLGGVSFDAFVPAMLAAVQHAVARDHPAHVSGDRGPQQVRHLRLALLVQQNLNNVHRFDEALLSGLIQASQHCRNVGIRT
jgi:hypothetical protein